MHLLYIRGVKSPCIVLEQMFIGDIIIGFEYNWEKSIDTSSAVIRH